jgi:nucleotide-binding universal stress UspA family protein
MVQQFIVPVDDSPDSWRAFDVALILAARSHIDVHLVHVTPDPNDARQADADIQLQLQRRGPIEVEVSVEVRLSIGTVASELEAVLALHTGAVVLMASHGKGRSAAIVGSVTEDLLRRAFGPVILVGPHVTPGDFGGPIMATVDGSPESEAALPLAAAWATEFGMTPWILHVSDETLAGRNNVSESSYPAGLAQELRSLSGHPVEFDELHDGHPDRAVADYASRHNASLIIASSHGRSGLSRLTMGSVTAGFVRHATCPVVVIRLPLPHRADAEAGAPARMWAY